MRRSIFAHADRPSAPLRVVTFGSDHPFTQPALDLISRLGWIEHVDHVRTFDEREFLQKPDSPAACSFLSAKRPDLFVSAGYGRILHEQCLSIPRIGAINVHPSLLPDYRGYEAVSWAMYEGRKEVGATVHEMTLEIDGGPIICQRAVPVGIDDTLPEVYERLVAIVPELLDHALQQIRERGALSGTPQQAQADSYRTRATRELDRLSIDWSRPTADILRGGELFAGYANVRVGGRRILIKRLTDTGRTDAQPGTILRRGLRSFDVAAGDRRRLRAEIGRRALPVWALANLMERLPASTAPRRQATRPTRYITLVPEPANSGGLATRAAGEPAHAEPAHPEAEHAGSATAGRPELSVR